jgi:hypothetical protein
MKAVKLEVEYGRGGMEVIFTKVVEIGDLGEHAFQYLQSVVAERESSADCEYCYIDDVNSGIAAIMTGEDTSTYFISEESSLYAELEEKVLNTDHDSTRDDADFLEFFEDFDQKIWQVISK